MSNILDAIRKAEADRHDDGVPSLEAIVQQKRSGRSRAGRRGPGWLIWVALILVIGSTGYLYKATLIHHGSNLKQRVAAKTKVLLKKVGGDSLIGQTYPTQPVLARSDDPVAVPSGVDATAKALTDRQRQLLDSLRFDVVSYSRDKFKRFAMIGSRTYREGDQLEGFIIRQILAEGVVLDVSGESVLIRP